MFPNPVPARPTRTGLLIAFAATAAFVLLGTVHAQQGRVGTLHIGSSGSLSSAREADERTSVETLRNFIKEETGLDNEILPQKSWHELADKMGRGELQLGVFQGYEFAWAKEKHPELKALALAVNGRRYPVAYVVAHRGNAAKDFAGLRGQSLSIPAQSPGFVRLFVDREAESHGKGADAFFSKINTPDNSEDALDDVVDGVVQVAAVDQAALEAFKRRKPGRFKQLEPVAKSQPFPPPVIAYAPGTLDDDTRHRFEQGLLEANRKERGQTMLTLFRLTGFEAVPADFGRVLAETRKADPAPSGR